MYSTVYSKRQMYDLLEVQRLICQRLICQHCTVAKLSRIAPIHCPFAFEFRFWIQIQKLSRFLQATNNILVFLFVLKQKMPLAEIKFPEETGSSDEEYDPLKEDGVIVEKILLYFKIS